jgi:hypothetical protein
MAAATKAIVAVERKNRPRMMVSCYALLPATLFDVRHSG